MADVRTGGDQPGGRQPEGGDCIKREPAIMIAR
jgi:hypothetical protein